jgi:cobalt-precorrin 5A hydrolase
MNSEGHRSSMKIQLAAFTKNGGMLCLRLQQLLNTREHDAEGFSKFNIIGLKPLVMSLDEFTRKAFSICDAVVFIGAAGIAVRAAAPYIKSKDSDPAVIVIDERGRYVIPVLSGHMGGANRLAETIASLLQADAVITTATDINGKFAVDTWAAGMGCRIGNMEKIKDVSSAILNGEQVGIYTDFPVDGDLPENMVISRKTRVGICISPRYEPFYESTLHIIPRQYVLGIGCRKNTKYEDLLDFMNFILETNGISLDEIEAMASIDLKKKEEALIRLSREWSIPFYTYTASELSQVTGVFTESSFVKAVTGVDNVCERAAVKANNGRLKVTKISRNGITAAVSKKEWRCRF